MISVSCLAHMPKIETWMRLANVSQNSMRYAKDFIAKLGDTANKFEWRYMQVDIDVPGIVVGYWTSSKITIILSFQPDGECNMHASFADSEDTLNNTCYLNKSVDDWVSVNATLDCIKMLVL